MQPLASATRYLFAFILLTGTAAAQSAESEIITNGTVITEIFSNGNIGGDCSGGHTGFLYNGFGGGGSVLCAISFVVGIDNTLTIGQVYAVTDESIGWVPGIIQAPTEFPYPALDEGVRTSFFDTEGVGLDVGLNAYYSTDADLDDFVVLRYEITNTSDAELTGIVPGLFVDWDLDPFAQNEATVLEDEDLMVISDPTSTTSFQVGTAVLDDELAGWTCMVGYPPGAGQPHDPQEVWDALTTAGPSTCDSDDIRGPIGVPPIDLAPDETAVVTFAMVAGDTQEDVVAHTAAARGALVVSSEESAQADAFAIRSAFPNPVADVVTIGFTLPEAQPVHLAVYDLLGRRIATLVDGARPTGEQSVTFDVSTLPGGVYVYRLTAGPSSLTDRFTVAR